MKRSFIYKNLLILVSLAVFNSLANAESLDGIAESLDGIELEDVTGKTHPISDYIGKGKWVVLNIWGPGCPPCEAEMPDLVRFHDKHANKDAMVLGIAIDFPSYGYANKSRVAAFMEEYLMDFPVLLSDSSITNILALGQLQGVPTTYVYTPEGKVAGMQVGGITEKILDDFINKQKAKRMPDNKNQSEK